MSSLGPANYEFNVAIYGMDYVSFKHENLGPALQDAIAASLQMDRLMPEEVVMFKIDYDDVNAALNDGNKLFDTFAWVGMNAEQRAKIKIVAKPAEAKKIDGKAVRDALAYLYMMLMIQARVPSTGSQIPKFLTDILSIKDDAGDLMKKIANFDLNKIRHTWIKHVDISKLPQQANSRLGLVLAGHRLMAPFILYTPKSQLAPELATAIDAVKAYRRKGFSWNVHSYTRTGDLLAKFGNINGNLSNMMFEAFTKEQLNDMAAKKIIYKAPDSYDQRHTQYKTWTVDMWTSVGDFVKFST